MTTLSLDVELRAHPGAIVSPPREGAKWVPMALVAERLGVSTSRIRGLIGEGAFASVACLGSGYNAPVVIAACCLTARVAGHDCEECGA